MGRTLLRSALTFGFVVGRLTACYNSNSSHGLSFSVDYAKLSQSEDTAQSCRVKESSTFEEPLAAACFSQVTEVNQDLGGASITTVNTRGNNTSSSVTPVNIKRGVMNMERYGLNSMEGGQLTFSMEDDDCDSDIYNNIHECIHQGFEMGSYRIHAYIGRLGLEARALHSPDYAYHPIGIARHSSGSMQRDGLALQMRLGEELVSQEFFSHLHCEYLNFNKQEELLLRRMWLLKGHFAGGSHGDVWRGKRFRGGEHGLGVESYVLKRMLQEKGDYVLSAGLREVYFGQLITSQGGHPRIVRFIESFYGEPEKGDTTENVQANGNGEGYYYPKPPNFKPGWNLWLVFRDEGLSLRQLLYSRQGAGNCFIYKRSAFWLKLKHLPHTFKEIIRQLLEGVLWLHQHGIVHRDIKPSNLIVHTDTNSNNKLGELRIADFSSAVDEGVQSAGFYKPNGPQTSESTLDYAPPEVRLNSANGEPFSSEVPTSYDMWSIGVVMLELILGTPEVFTLNQRTRAVLTFELDRGKVDPATSEDILFLTSLADMCIYHPAAHGDMYQLMTSFIESKCGIEELARALQARDPTGQGWTADQQGLDLLSRLLEFEPARRISAQEALLHPYFRGLLDGEEYKHHQETGLVHVESSLPVQETWHPEHNITFYCPTCGRAFHGSWNGCVAHSKGRKHGEFCEYEDSTLPRCMSSLLDPLSGWCDIKGRRSTIEDYHSIEFNERYRFYGHKGSLAAKYATFALHRNLQNILDPLLAEEVDAPSTMKAAFRKTHEDILQIATQTDPPDESGTTATVALVMPHRIIIAHVGDSRAILCCRDGKAWVLTKDHTPKLPDEERAILQKGGFIADMGGIARVNGDLAITRALGSLHLAHILTAEPDVMDIPLNDGDGFNFLILASDGLWDVLSPQEAVNMVQLVISQGFGAACMQEGARRLVREAYIRGSTDNIGVCVAWLSKQVMPSMEQYFPLVPDQT